MELFPHTENTVKCVNPHRLKCIRRPKERATFTEACCEVAFSASNPWQSFKDVAQIISAIHILTANEL
jgi:hypothetical protein